MDDTTGNRPRDHAREAEVTELVRQAHSGEQEVADRAALLLGRLADPRAAGLLLDIIRQRWAEGTPFSAQVYALGLVRDPDTAIDLVAILLEAPYRPALNAGYALRDLWPLMSGTQRDEVRALLKAKDDTEVEEWRSDWIGDILREGGWRT